MYTKISEGEKKSVVSQYLDGKSVMELSAEYDIPRSTIYSWIEKYRNLKSMNGPEVCYQDYYNLKRRAGKLEDMLKVIKAAGCGLSAPLQEKLKALERLRGQFSVRTLCDALEVSRGTFYNHIFRRKDVTWYEKRREELYRKNYKSENEFRNSIDCYIQFYNTERPHGTISYKTPDRYEQDYWQRLSNK